MSEVIRYEYDDGSIAHQRECPDCDRGLLLAPVRFCVRCGGTGFLVRWEARSAEDENGA